MTKSKKEKIEYLGWANFGLGVATFVVMSIWNCHQDSKIEAQRIFDKSLEFQPTISVDSQPKVKSISYIFDSTDANKAIKEYLKGTDTIISIGAKIELTIQYTLHNNSNNTADVVGIFQMANKSTYDDIREFILGEKDGKFDSVPLKLLESLPAFQIRPNHPEMFTIVDTIEAETGKETTIHFLIIYQGKTKAIYDTYYWSNMVFNEMMLKPAFRVQNGQLQVKTSYETKVPRAQVVTYCNSREQTHIYDEKKPRLY